MIEAAGGDVRAPVEADAVAEAALGEGGGEAGRADVVEGEEFAFGVELMEGFGGLLEGVEIGEVVGVARDCRRARWWSRVA